jgi:hypothetical protein
MLCWAGPFDLSAGETFTEGYWVVAADVSPGQYPSRASISRGKETTDPSAGTIGFVGCTIDHAAFDQVLVTSLE